MFVLHLLWPCWHVSCFSPLRRRWWWRGRSRGATSIMLWLRHAFPHCVLEGPVRLRTTDRVLERLGLLHSFHQRHRSPHCHHRRSGLTLRLHRGAPRHCDRSGVCGFGNFYSRWVIIHLACRSAARVMWHDRLLKNQFSIESLCKMMHLVLWCWIYVLSAG